MNKRLPKFKSCNKIDRTKNCDIDSYGLYSIRGCPFYGCKTCISKFEGSLE